MKEAVAEVLALLDLERLEDNLFRGQSQDFGSGNVYGGQVLGQALMAAAQTIPADRDSIAHSLHAYFLLPGNMKAPVVYDVDRIRDGRSFDTRRVRAIQHGRPIFNLSASFQKREKGLEHQSAMPDVPGPDGLLNEEELRRKSSLFQKLPPEVRKRFLRERSIEMRPVDQNPDPINDSGREPKNYYWLRCEASLPDDPILHQGLLAYASDMNLLSTAMQAHKIRYLHPRLQAASLDHAMWFHHDFHIDKWLLYAVDSPCSSGGRGFSRGMLYTQDGLLVASTAQEGLMRMRSDTSFKSSTQN